MLSKKDIEELATGAVKRYFNTCNLISPQIQENDKTPDWDGYLFEGILLVASGYK